MTALKDVLPPVKSLSATSDPWFRQRFGVVRHSGAEAMQRMIRMVELSVDPLQPPKFKHKRLPKGNGSSPPVPVPVIHSPPRPVTLDDQKDWKVPPCISNWKNPKGYTIPLHKRLAAADGGRGLQQVQVNDNFAHLSEALYVAEQHARDAVSMRSKLLKETILKQKVKREEALRAMAQKARSERTSGAAASSGPFVTEHAQCDLDPLPREEREDRIQRRKERERERRLEAMGKKRKITRGLDRDMSEKVALGVASSAGGGGEVIMYDQRLFNQEKGMDSGFGFATDDQYSVYDKGLVSAQPTGLFTLYRPIKDNNIADEEMYDENKTDRFTCAAARPVEFEREDAADPFGLDQFIKQVTGTMNVGC